MTIETLISQLVNLPNDTEVWVHSSNGGLVRAERVAVVWPRESNKVVIEGTENVKD